LSRRTTTFASQKLGLALGSILPVGESLGTLDGKALTEGILLVDGTALVEGAVLGSAVKATGGALGTIDGAPDGLELGTLLEGDTLGLVDGYDETEGLVLG
jgi:hypothetical protein